MNIELIQKIHASDTMAVVAITGGGTEAIGELLRHGNGSRSLLEAVVPYDQNAFDGFLGGKPDKYCSEHAARQIAMAAFQRAGSLAPMKNVVGVAATCSLVKENERAGREHSAYIGLQSEDHTVSYALKLVKPRSREEEEHVVSEFLLAVLAEACGVGGPPSLPDEPCERREGKATPVFRTLVSGQTKVRFVAMPNHSLDHPVLFPGSFNPTHDGHRRMAAHARDLTGRGVVAEISIKNVDKPVLDYIELHKRQDYIREHDADVFDGIYFTNAPTFVEKVALFPGHTWIVGSDTMARINDVRYYGSEENRLRAHAALISARFLVYPRIVDGRAYTKEDFGKLSYFLTANSTFIEDIEPLEMSSSQIRRR